MAETPTDPPGWIHPDQVTRMHQLKLKKRALQARIKRASLGTNRPALDITVAESSGILNSSGSQKRKNPFLKNDANKKTKDDLCTDVEASGDSLLFELMKYKTKEPTNTIESPKNSSLTFSSILSKLEHYDEALPETDLPKGKPYIPIDWTLNTKMRLMSQQPFPWNCKLKTSEQASGTTGFVRCIDTSTQETTLDTSPNARFHQCCLVWQHPSLPWMELFPRTAGKISASLASNSAVAQSSFIRDALFADWSESFRSLFHLLRARQCPYFYMCANSFTALFRAAGICGVSEVHAFVTPTTRGFRQSLKQEEIEYTMPLRPGRKRRSDTTDSGCDTLDSTTSNIIAPDHIEDHQNLPTDDDDDDDNLLESLGLDGLEIRKIHNRQKRLVMEKESEVDRLKQSLIFVKGIEAQALFNFLINCKSAVASTGALSGIPPTLLAPVAFHGASLRPLKIRESIICVDNEKYHSLEIKGPILPHVLPSLCNLTKSSQLEQYSVSCAQLASTKAFTEAKHGCDASADKENQESNPESVFGQENLSDCGFNAELLSHFCNSEPAHMEVFDSLKHSNDGYTWS